MAAESSHALSASDAGIEIVRLPALCMHSCIYWNDTEKNSMAMGGDNAQIKKCNTGSTIAFRNNTEKISLDDTTQIEKCNSEYDLLYFASKNTFSDLWR